jgi:hypothetical protein
MDDSIALWNEHTRTLLSGDAVITLKDSGGSPRTQSTTTLPLRHSRGLSALPVEHLLPGHGPPIHFAAPWQPVAGGNR